MTPINKAVKVIGDVADSLRTSDYSAMIDIVKRAHLGMASKAEIEAMETTVTYNYVFFTPACFRDFKRDAKAAIKKVRVA